ncbi:gustatory receptor for sugar taste 64b-like [Vanessa tameamea]|uniref:Gustatory receptor for sugar taste 64b-like n=1 Tax=Vanessa tameamea TaxID=334116 RepID=A0ABM4AZY2_VANTA
MDERKDLKGFYESASSKARQGGERDSNYISVPQVIRTCTWCTLLINQRGSDDRLMACAKNRRIPWMDLQAHYTRLTRLVKIIDDYINPFVFMTFLSNLVVVCKHIYDIIQRQKAVSMNSYNPNCGIAKSSDWIVVVDSIISTLHLIFRTTLVSTFTAHLHTLSREPLRALHTLPASAYNIEVQRFMDQVYHSKIHLSGLGYFYVTRVTVLSMLSTIVTYELVLLQLPVYYY